MRSLCQQECFWIDFGEVFGEVFDIILLLFWRGFGKGTIQPSLSELGSLAEPPKKAMRCLIQPSLSEFASPMAPQRSVQFKLPYWDCGASWELRRDRIQRPYRNWEAWQDPPREP